MDTDKLKKQASQQIQNLIGEAIGLTPQEVQILKVVLKYALRVAVIAVFMIVLVLQGPAMSNVEKTQYPVNNQSLFIKSNGTCLPTGATTYLAFFNAAGKKYNVDPNLLIAMAQKESSFNPNAKNATSGASGLIQLMPGTFEGARDTSKVDNAFDPEANIYAGANYIHQQLTNPSFQGGSGADVKVGQYNKRNLDLALAAYNAGPGNVQKYGGVPPFPETQDYLKKIEANYQTIFNCQNKTTESSFGQKAAAIAIGLATHNPPLSYGALANFDNPNPTQMVCATLVAYSYWKASDGAWGNWKNINRISSFDGATTDPAGGHQLLVAFYPLTDVSQLQPGDILFRGVAASPDGKGGSTTHDYEHTALYVGDGKVVQGGGGGWDYSIAGPASGVRETSFAVGRWTDVHEFARPLKAIGQ